jgi:hypothetical protein
VLSDVLNFKTMVKEVFTFNHDVENVNEALGLSDEQDDACREAIFFSTISNYLIGLELFDEPNDVPKSLKTMTGDLEKSLGLVTTEKEKSYLLFIFKNMHDLCIESIAKYKFLKDSEGKDEDGNFAKNYGNEDSGCSRKNKNR